jgi:hypothetical protein
VFPAEDRDTRWVCETSKMQRFDSRNHRFVWLPCPFESCLWRFRSTEEVLPLRLGRWFAPIRMFELASPVFCKPICFIYLRISSRSTAWKDLPVRQVLPMTNDTCCCSHDPRHGSTCYSVKWHHDSFAAILPASATCPSLWNVAFASNANVIF